MRRLVTKWFGAFLWQDGRIQEHRWFPQDAQEIAERMDAVAAGEVLSEEQDLAKSGNVVVGEARLSALGRLEAGALVEVPPPTGFTVALLQEAAVQAAMRRSRVAAARSDQWLVHAVRMLETLNRDLNAQGEQAREWTALARPLQGSAAGDAWLAQVADGTLDLGQADAMGTTFGAKQIEAVRGVASALTQMASARDALEKEVLEQAQARAPALCHLLGAPVASRLIAFAGGLDRLASLPAGTVQTLGAESALFEHLRNRKDPPKHGVLFRHEAVNMAPAKQRGRIARSLAAKAALAARMDAHGADPEAARAWAEGVRTRLLGGKARPEEASA